MKALVFLAVVFTLVGAYDIKVPYVPRAFPKAPLQAPFLLPLDSSGTAILCPEAGKKAAEALSRWKDPIQSLLTQ